LDEVFALFHFKKAVERFQKYFSMRGTSVVVGRSPRTAHGEAIDVQADFRPIDLSRRCGGTGGGFAAFLTPVASQTKAETSGQAAPVERSNVKGDRLPRLLTGRACSSASWPNYDQPCQFDLRRSADDVRVVRMVNLEKTSSPIVAVKH